MLVAGRDILEDELVKRIHVPVPRVLSVPSPRFTYPSTLLVASRDERR